LCFGVLHAGTATIRSTRCARAPPADLGNGRLPAGALRLRRQSGDPSSARLAAEAHPAAPSPVSALMSGIMIKTAIYGMVRVIFDLIGHVRWEWGLLVLVIGAGTRSSAYCTR